MQQHPRPGPDGPAPHRTPSCRGPDRRHAAVAATWTGLPGGLEASARLDSRRRLVHAGGMSRRHLLRASLSVIASVSLLSCSSSPTESRPYGSATVQPSTVERGGTIAITPTSEIQPICLGLARVRSALAGHDPVFQLGDGWWEADGATPASWPACLPAPSSAPATLRFADDFPEGTYVICLTWGLTEDGCGTVTVVSP